MAKQLEMYRCNVCGNLVQVLVGGKGELVCCGEPMEHLIPEVTDLMSEKHVPVFSKNDNGEKVIKVGSEPHPMINEHYIMFIETISSDSKKVRLEYLYPGDKPEIIADITGVNALEYCNIHGLWKNE